MKKYSIGKVLIVDDKHSNIELIDTVLQMHNIETCFAFSGKEALKKVEDEEISLILLDAKMPDMDGFETCKHLKSNNKTKEIPVIFISAFENTAFIIKSFEYGAVDYIKKPFNNEEIIARVKTHLEIQSKIKIIERQNIKLKNKELKFQNIFNSSKDGIIILDVNGKILEANSIIGKRNSLPLNKLINKNINQIISEQRAIKIQKLVEQVNPTNNLITETNYCSENGEQYFLELNISKIIFKNKESFLIVSRDITQRRINDKKILDTIIETEEKERAKFSLELHDGIGPMLSTIKMYFEWLSETDDSKKKKIIVKKGQSFINETVEELKTISNNISPILLKTFGLIYAIKSFIDRIKEISKINFNFNYNCDERINSKLEFILYRIITELINNTLKHTKANKIKIDFDLNETTNILNINYFDNGHGFDINTILAKSKGMGIANIYHRINTIGGNIDIKSGNSSLNINITINIKN